MAFGIQAVGLPVKRIATVVPNFLEVAQGGVDVFDDQTRRVPGRAGDLRQQMEIISGDPAVKARVIRFLHTHSHMEQIGEPEHDLSVLSETPAILGEVLALIKENDSMHYEAMMTMCSG